MARGLIVGCGCRGRLLGRGLLEAGWVMRGTSRDEAALAAIADAGIEAVLADPDALATLLDWVGDVAVVYWLLGSARGEPDAVAALHGPRLERLLEELVDTPVRGFVYEAAGTVAARDRERGAELCRAAAARWRIPVEVCQAAPDDPAAWRDSMTAAAERLTGAGRLG